MPSGKGKQSARWRVSVLVMIVVISLLSSYTVVAGSPAEDDITSRDSVNFGTITDFTQSGVNETTGEVENESDSNGSNNLTLNESDVPDDLIATQQHLTSPSELVRRNVIVTKPSAVEEKTFHRYNVTVIKNHDRYYTVDLPRENISSLRDLSWVKLVRTPVRSYPAVVSEGVADMDADDVHVNGYTGSGVRVAIVSCEGIDTSNPEISGQIKASKSYSSSGISNNGENNHGTAVAEIVADVAPEADLYAVNYDGLTGFAAAADWVKENNIDVAVYSCTWFGRPDDGTGDVSQIVDETVRNGTAWFNSAGNDAEGHYEATFNDPDADKLHNIDSEGTEINKIRDTPEVDYFTPELEPGDTFIVEIEWDDWPTTDHDLDVFIYDIDDEETVKVAASDQTGGVPTDTVSFRVPDGEEGNYGVIVYGDESAIGTEFELTTRSPSFTGEGYVFKHRVLAGSIQAPATAIGATAVAAYDVTTGDRASYSSVGPTDDRRRGIDISAPTTVSTTAYESSFTGTSAAAPHAAGVAALMLEKNPTLTPAQIEGIQISSAIDIGASGIDIYTGGGKLDAAAAVAATPGRAFVSAEVRDSTGTAISTAEDGIAVQFRNMDTGALLSGGDIDTRTFSFSLSGRTQRVAVAAESGYRAELVTVDASKAEESGLAEFSATSTVVTPAAGETVEIDVTLERSSSDDITIANYETCTDVQESSPYTCPTGTITDTFQPSDDRAISWIEFRNLNTAVEAEWQFYTPSGRLFKIVNDTYNEGGSFYSSYKIWAWINIFGSEAASISGEWRVDVVVNGENRFTDRFTIEPPDEIGVELRAESNSADVNETVTYVLLATSVSDGVSAFDTNVTISNSSVARIISASVVPDGAIANSKISTDGSTVRLQAVGAKTADSGEVSLATITVRAEEQGQTQLRLTGENVYGNDQSVEYIVSSLEEPRLTVGSLTGPVVTDSGNPATDPDNDGKYEDITGDKRFNILDVNALLNHLDNSAVTTNIELFDFNDDNKINILDVAELLAET